MEDLIALADEAGLSLTHLAMAFVLEHPGVTSAIIGPRTMEQLTDVLDGADTRLSDDVLDRIDEIVPPGTNVNVADTGWEAASLRRSQRRAARTLPDGRGAPRLRLAASPTSGTTIETANRHEDLATSGMTRMRHRGMPAHRNGPDDSTP